MHAKSKREAQRQRERARQAAEESRRRRQARRRTLIATGLAVLTVVLIAVVAVVVGRSSPDDALPAATDPPRDSARTAPDAPTGQVQTLQVPSADHVQGPVDYPQTPPVGGPHNPVWQNCGFYDQPVRDEHAVHSLEHGAVWVTYRPELPAEQVATLRALAESHGYVLVSPYPDLPSAVVASAWGVQLRLDGAEAARLEEFVDAYAQGPQTPEPGAPCNGGLDRPAPQ